MGLILYYFDPIKRFEISYYYRVFGFLNLHRLNGQFKTRKKRYQKFTDFHLAVHSSLFQGFFLNITYLMWGQLIIKKKKGGQNIAEQNLGWGQQNNGGWGQQAPNTGEWGQPQVPGNTVGNLIPGVQNILGFVTPNATWGNQLEGNKWVQFQQ